MVVTRSRLNAKAGDGATPKKIKFLDNDAEVNDIEYHTAEEEEPNQSADSDESDSGSDSDEAPEEESTTGIKNEIIAKQKEDLKKQQELKKLEKERRRQQTLYNQQQQQLKKNKKQEDELPEFLPEDIFESISDNEAEDSEPIIPSKHLKLQDFEKLDEMEIRRQIKQSKLKDLKKSKKLSIKKGPVHVKVQQFNLDKKVVPKFENKVVNTRNKWLKRKSLGKK
ncbi:uncharacterized protein AC631_03651 [Debaryomyces fabryi]|uniref:Uncharacterized protein n=1 Tax=Debaryomyces fabryi TaxID=58627 RepID=A0A0V1PWH5_9ASCO|nr:uncharacterized protein AC631_03651 [Debaryomyces fabryi]KSA00606.1 hypothetical protein AC631_03651 [Debaryomyces fabryi]CUM56225.1 unnamed protein product [Debaryomyces fabryi]